MRYLIVEPSPSGGLFQFCFQLGKHLAEQGHRVQLLTGPDPELSGGGPRFEVLPSLPTWHPGATRVEGPLLRKSRRLVRGLRHVAALARVAAHVATTRPDVVLWHQPRFAMDSWTMLVTRRLAPHSLMALVSHEPRPLAEQRRSGSLYRRNPVLLGSLGAAMRRFDAVFVLGDNARADLRGHWRRQGDVTVIPHGPEDVFLSAGPGATPVDRTGPAVLFFGTWLRHKGIDVLLDAFAEVREVLPSATLTLAGAVGADVSLPEIQRRAAAVGGVRLRPGYVPLAEVPRLMGEARVVAVPYLRANQSGVVHLAHTFGRPVVASAVGDIPAVVADDETGLLVHPGDRPALRQALLRLLEDPEHAAKLGRQGRERLEQTASWDSIAARVAERMESLSDRR